MAAALVACGEDFSGGSPDASHPLTPTGDAADAQARATGGVRSDAGVAATGGRADAAISAGGAEPIASGGAHTGGTSSGGRATGGQGGSVPDAGSDAAPGAGGIRELDSGDGGTIASGGADVGAGGNSSGGAETGGEGSGGESSSCAGPLPGGNGICDDECPVEPPTSGNGGTYCEILDHCDAETAIDWPTGSPDYDWADVLPTTSSRHVGAVFLPSGLCARYTSSGSRTFIHNEDGEPRLADCNAAGEGESCIVVTSSDEIVAGQFLSPRCSSNRPEATRCEWILVVTPAGAPRGWVMAESRPLRSDGSCPLSCP